MTLIQKRILFFLGFVFLLDIYLSGGIWAAFSGTAPLIRQTALGLFWLLQILFLSWLSKSLLLSGDFRTRGMKSIGRIGGISVMLIAPALVFGILLFGEDIYRLIRLIVAGIDHLIQSDPALQMQGAVSRSVLLSRVGLAIVALLTSIIGYGITRGKYRYKIHSKTIRFPDLPDAFNGVRIVQLSDIHAGSFDNKEAVKKGVELVNRQKPDLIFFTGDLVNNAASEMVPWIDVFRELKATEGKYSILGNHDYGDYVAWPSPADKKANLEQLYEVHKKLEFRLLRNESIRIIRGNDFIDLLGMENWGTSFAQYGDLQKTLINTAAASFKILLSHDPSHWEEQVMDGPVRIPLTLAGHTHGMQFGFELFGIQFSPARLRYKRWAGLYQKGRRYLYVNRGFGFLGFPGRVGIWPEITVLTLKRA